MRPAVSGENAFALMRFRPAAAASACPVHSMSCRVSPPGELLHHRGQRVQVVDEERADAKALAQVRELARQVLDAADEHMRRVQYLLGRQLDPGLLTEAAGAAARLGARIAGDDHRPAGGVGIELQLAETVAGGLADPADLLCGCRGSQAPGI